MTNCVRSITLLQIASGAALYTKKQSAKQILISGKTALNQTGLKHAEALTTAAYWKSAVQLFTLSSRDRLIRRRKHLPIALLHPNNHNKTSMKALWTGQLRVDEKWRPLFSVFVVIFAIILPITFLPAMIHQAALGPGLGDPTGEETWKAFVAMLQAQPSQGPLYLVMGLATFGVLFRIRCIAAGYFKWQNQFGEKFPIRYIAVFILTSATGIVAIYALLSIVGLATWLAGFDFGMGWQAVEHLSAGTHQWVMANIPTLVNLPAWMAVLIVYMFQGFLHYWLHRFGHTFRAGWLLFHRPHHMSPALIYPTTTEVFFAIPLFLIAVVPYNLVFAASSKLFSAEPVYLGTLIINLFVVISEIYGHNSALYHEGRKNPLIRTLGWTFLNGPYHYLHHS